MLTWQVTAENWCESNLALTWKWVASDQGETNINSLRHPNKTIESIEDVWINIYNHIFKKNMSKYIVAGKLQSYAMYHNTSHNKIIRHHMTKDWSEQESSVRFSWIGHRTLLVLKRSLPSRNLQIHGAIFLFEFSWHKHHKTPNNHNPHSCTPQHPPTGSRWPVTGKWMFCFPARILDCHA